jgi:hypothetical protein
VRVEEHKFGSVHLGLLVPTVLKACGLSLGKSLKLNTRATKHYLPMMRIWPRISPPVDKGLVCTFA